MNLNPLVSVILAVNEDNGFLDESINSVLTQTYTNFEFLIIANNCSDALWQYIEGIRDLDVRVRAYRLSLGGLCFALNYGVNIAKGTYIARIDADDVCIKTRLEKQISFLIENPSVDLLGTHAVYIDDEGIELARKCYLPCTHKGIAKVLPWKSPIIHPSVIGKKSFFIDQGGYKFGFYGEDYDLWLRGYFAGYKYHILPDKLLKYRFHSNQSSKSSYSKKQATYIKSLLRINEKDASGYMEKIKFKFGIMVQSRFFFTLIRSTSILRNKLKTMLNK